MKTVLTDQEPVLELMPIRGAGEITLGEWLEDWLEYVIRPNREDTTYYGYQSIVRNHAIPAMGRVPLAQLDPMRIQAYYSWLRMEKGLSANTVHKHHILLHTALKTAFRQGLLEENPVDRVEAPRQAPPRQSYYDSAQLRALLRAARGHRLELVTACLDIPEDTFITPAHVQRLVTEGYLRPLRARCPDKKVVLMPRTDGSLYQRAVASLLRQEQDVSLLKKEWFCPQPRLIVCGGGHVSREVAALAARLDFTTRVIDERPELLTRERFPTADELICDSYDNLEQHLEPGACYVVVTPNHKADFRCVAAILSTDYAYLGMMGSKRKVAATFEQLRLEGFSQQQIDTIFAPIGLPIGAVTPAEIALSILAQIIEQKNRHHIASADRSLLETTEQGVLCIVIEKHGSVPRGVGSMMLVTADHILGSIGGGEGEYRAICHAREGAGLDIQTYALHNDAAGGLDMVCGGTMKVLFLPV